MSYPRKYPTSDGSPLDERDHNAMVDRVNGITAGGEVLSYPYTYMLRVNGGVYEAIDSQHNLSFGGSSDAGSVDGTDASAVIQAAWNNAPNGATIFHSGHFPCETALTLTNKALNLIGEGVGEYPHESSGTILEKKFNGDLITVTATDTLPFSIRNMALISDKSTYTGHGIVVSGVYPLDWILERLRIRNFAGNAIRILNCGKHTLKDIYASYTDDDTIYMTGSGDWQWYNVEADWGATENKAAARIEGGSNGEIIGGHFEGYYGLYVDGSYIRCIGAKIVYCTKTAIYSYTPFGAHSVYLGNIILRPNRGEIDYGDGIYLASGSGQVVVSGNTIIDPDNYMRRAIVQAGNSDTGIIIKDNIVSGASIQNIKALSAATIVRNNAGWITENQGMASSISDGSTITHGLAGAPTTVTLTPNTKDVLSFGVTNRASDTFTVGCTFNIITEAVFHWKAEYNPPY